MSSRSYTAGRAGRPRPRRAATRGGPGRRSRRRLRLLAGAIALALIAFAVAPLFHHAVRELTMPLTHEDIIRQQAQDKHLDPALIAAVIYAESKFRDQTTSSAGARGLMQLTPQTARYIARLSGGTRFNVSDLGTPQVNIAYGSYYLRYLLDHYHGDVALALAAYNGGETNVDRWVRQAGGHLRAEDIPFPETRAYVQRVLHARHEYRQTYPQQLGLR